MESPYNFGTLSADLIALGIMFQYQEMGNPISFSELVDIMGGKFPRNRVSLAEDRLMDLGLINTKWKTKGERWMKVYVVLSEATMIAQEILSFMMGDSTDNDSATLNTRIGDSPVGSTKSDKSDFANSQVSGNDAVRGCL